MSAGGRKISTPIVLASSSAMVAIGIAAWAMSSAPEQTRIEQQRRTSHQTLAESSVCCRVHYAGAGAPAMPVM